MKTRPRVLVVDDDDFISTMLGKTLRREGYDVRVETCGDHVVSVIGSWSPAVVMLDVRLPGRTGIEILAEVLSRGLDTQVIMLTADDTAETAVRAMKLGAVDYFIKPFNTNEVKIVVRNLIERSRLQREVTCLRRANEELTSHAIIGRSPLMEEIKTQLKKMTEASIGTLLLTGESGTGKELFASYAHRLIHETDGHGYAPFVRVNCATLPDTLLESELFGHAKGAFTDARTDRKGLFELAHGGTILLDEIGEMHPNLQSKLLRVLEERIIRRLGAGDEIPVSVTVIATTNRNLPDGIDRGHFRMDLFYRLNAFSIAVPPLRDRRDDIPVLADHFLAHFSSKYNKKTQKKFSSEALQVLTAHSWPGNVREMKNVIERLVVLEVSDDILPEHLPKEMVQGRHARAEKNGFCLPEEGISLDELQESIIRQAFAKANHNKSQAAKLLRMNYDTFRYHAKKFSLL